MKNKMEWKGNSYEVWIRMKNKMEWRGNSYEVWIRMKNKIEWRGNSYEVWIRMKNKIEWRVNKLEEWIRMKKNEAQPLYVVLSHPWLMPKAFKKVRQLAHINSEICKRKKVQFQQQRGQIQFVDDCQN